MTTPYIPRRDSLAALVCGYFQNNPTEALTIEDIAEKFAIRNRGNIHTELGDAWRADLIRRDHDIDGQVIYTAGNLEFTSRALDELASPIKPSRNSGKGKGTARPAAALPAPTAITGWPDPATVPLEDNVPCTARSQVRIDWTPLLKRMQVGQSAVLPRRCKATLTKCITEVHKKHPSNKFTVQCHKDATELRVWRVA